MSLDIVILSPDHFNGLWSFLFNSTDFHDLSQFARAGVSETEATLRVAREQSLC